MFKNYDESFNTHLNVFKAFFCTPKKIRVIEHVILEVLCASSQDVQKFRFKITMKSNAKVALGSLDIINPLTKMWRIIFHFIFPIAQHFEYVKLAKIAIIETC